MARAAMALFALLTSAAKPELVLRPDAIPKADALRMPPAAVRARRIAMTENAVTTVAAANAAPVPAIWCAVMGNAIDCNQLCADQEATCGWLIDGAGGHFCGDRYCGDCPSEMGCHVNTCRPYCSDLDCLSILSGGSLNMCVIAAGGTFSDTILCI